MYCTQCGAANSDADRFCKNCGQPLANNAPPPSPPPQPSYAPAPNYQPPPAYNQPPAGYAPPPYQQPPSYGGPQGYGTPYYQGAQPTSQSRLMAAIAYFIPFIGPAIALMTAKGEKFVRFHAWQAGIYDALAILCWILVAFIGNTVVFWLVYLLLTVIGIMALVAFIQAIMGKTFKIPLIGQLADNLSG